MTEPAECVEVSGTHQDPKIWLERWRSVFWLAEELLGLVRTPSWTNNEIMDHLRGLADNYNNLSDQINVRTTSDRSAVPLTLNSRQKNLRHAAQGMMLFAAQQFAFLTDGLFGHLYFEFNTDLPAENPSVTDLNYQRVTSQIQEKVGLLTEILYLTSDYVLNQALNQIIEDIVTLSLAYSQSDLRNDSEIADRLRTCDGLIQQIRSTVGKHLPDTALILSYIRSGTNVRTMPYGPVGMLGISASALTHNPDLLSIPHELGHFLYWRGQHGPEKEPEEKKTYRQQTRSFVKTLIDEKQKPKWLMGWLEEIFADVVGCVIGGPAAALTFQDMMLAKIGSSFTAFDNHYPVAAARPFIYLRVLSQFRKTGSAFVEMDTALTKLTNRWHTVLKERLGCTNLDVSRESLNEVAVYRVSITADRVEITERSLAAIVDDLDQICDKLLEELPELTEWAQHAWTSGALGPSNDVSQLYTEFNQCKISQLVTQGFFDPVQLVPFPTWPTAIGEHLDKSTRDQIEKLSGTSEKTGQEKLSWVVDVFKNTQDQLVAVESVCVPYETWQAVLYYGGGSTGGPGGGSGHVT